MISTAKESRPRKLRPIPQDSYTLPHQAGNPRQRQGLYCSVRMGSAPLLGIWVLT
jgi:hypothetical protein